MLIHIFKMIFFLLLEIILLKIEKKINSYYLETIFKPNKTSQKILSATRTELDITVLILNLIIPFLNQWFI